MRLDDGPYRPGVEPAIRFRTLRSFTAPSSASGAQRRAPLLGILAVTMAVAACAGPRETPGPAAYQPILPAEQLALRPDVNHDPPPLPPGPKPRRAAPDIALQVALDVSAVPRAFSASLPVSLHDTDSTTTRKQIFITTVLPLVLRANEAIQAERQRVLTIAAQMEKGRAANATERSWLAEAYARYGVAEGDVDTLVRRMDVVPPSLAIAQAAIESGWGRSRFALEGNALFGQWTWSDGSGLVPKKRPDGHTYAIKAYQTIYESVADYMRNLNTHRAYRAFRVSRAAMRAAGEMPTGASLAQALSHYSERREAYVQDLHSIIRVNRLSRFDRARLETPARAANLGI